MSVKECVQTACDARDSALAHKNDSAASATESGEHASDSLDSANSAAASANYKGAWDGGTAYLLGESVYRTDAFYRCNVGNTNKDPLLNPTEWQKVESTEEAPKDGVPYVRKDGYWVPMEAAKNSVGVAGSIGFGVAAIDDTDLPSGFIKLDGHDNPSSVNYGNVIDPNGSVMVYVPAFWFRWNIDNTIDISATAQTGYVMHRAFRDGGADKPGFFIDKYQGGNVGGVLVAQQGIDPCSTNSAHNPIASLTAAPANNYGGMYAAVAGRGAGYNLTAQYQYNALAILAYAQGKAADSVATCAFIDVLPHMQKGCNNNALKDTNDSSVVFTSSGYSNCGLTGSGIPFNKTTHNGQSCGVADLNGNMWEVAPGLIYLAKTGATGTSGTTTLTMANSDLALDDVIYFGGTPSSGSTYNTAAYTITDVTGDTITLDTSLERDILATDGVYSSKYFRTLKDSVALSSIVNDSTTQASGGAYDVDLYDLLDLTGIVGQTITSRYGNGVNPVFDMSTDTATDAYKRMCSGIPLATGKSSGGSTEFGNDYFYEYNRNELACRSIGDWTGASDAGAFALHLGGNRGSSGGNVGGRASFFV